MALNLGTATAVIDLNISGLTSKAAAAASALKSLDAVSLRGPDLSAFGRIAAQAQTAAKSVQNAFADMTLKMPDADLSSLADAVAQTQESAASVANAFEGIDLATPPVDAGSLAEASTQAASAAGSVQAAFDQQTLATPPVDTSSLAQAAAAGDAAAQHIQDSFDAVNLAVGAAPAGAFGLATKGAIDFGAAMANVNSIAQLSEGELAKVSTQVEGLAVQLGRSPTDLAEGLYNVYSVGFEGADALHILGLAAKDANAGLSTTETTTGLLTGVLLSYGMEVKDAAHVSDVLFQEVNDGANSFEGLAHNMAQTVPLASSMGVSIEELSAAYALMTSRGIPVAQTETDIAALMRAGLSPTKAMTQALNEHGYASVQDIIATKGLSGYLEFLQEASGGTAEGMYKLLGTQEGVAAALTLTKGGIKNYTDELNKMIHASDGAGATNRALAKQMDATKFHLQRLGAAFDVFKISIGAAFEPFIKSAADFGVQAINAFLALPGPIRTIMSLVSGAAAGFLGLSVGVALFGGKVKEVLGVASTMGRVLITGFTSIGPAIGSAIAALGPFLPVILAIAAAAALLYAAYKTNFLGFGDLVDGAISKVKKFAAGFAAGFSDARKTMNPFSAALMGLSRGIVTAFGGKDHMVTGFAKTLSDAFYNAAGWVQKFGTYIQHAFAFGTQFQQLDRFGFAMRGFAASIGIPIAAVGKLVQAFHKGGWTGLAKEIPNTIGHMGDAFQAFNVGVSRLFQELGGKFPGLKNITDPLAHAFDQGGKAANAFAHAVGSALKGDWRGAFKDIQQGAGLANKAFLNLGKAGAAVLEDVGNLLQKGVGGAMSYLSRQFPAFNGLWDRFRGIGQGVGGVVKNIGQALGDLFRGNFAGAFKNLGQAGLDGLKVIGNAMGTLPSLIAGVFKSISWSGVGSALQDGLGKASDLAFKGLNAAGGAIAKGWDGLTNALQNFSWSGLGSTLLNGLEGAAGLAFSALSAGQSALGNLWGWLSDTAGNIDWGGIANTLTGGAAGALANLAGAVAGAAGDLWGWIKTKAGEIDWAGIGSAILRGAMSIGLWLLRGIQSGAEAVWTWFKNLGVKIALAMGGHPESFLTDAGKRIIQGLWNGLKSVWNSVLSWFEGALNDLIGLVNKVIGVVNKLSDITGIHIDPIPYIGFKQTLIDLQHGYEGAATGALAFAKAQAAVNQVVARAAQRALNAAFPPPGAKATEPAPKDNTLNKNIPGVTPIAPQNAAANAMALASKAAAALTSALNQVDQAQGNAAVSAGKLSTSYIGVQAASRLGFIADQALAEAHDAAAAAQGKFAAGLNLTGAALGAVAAQVGLSAANFSGLGTAMTATATGIGAFATSAVAGAAGAVILQAQLAATSAAAAALSAVRAVVTITGDNRAALDSISAAVGALGAADGLTATDFMLGDNSNAVASIGDAVGTLAAADGLTATNFVLGDNSNALGAIGDALGALASAAGTTATTFIDCVENATSAAAAAAAALASIAGRTVTTYINTVLTGATPAAAHGGIVGHIRSYATGGYASGGVVLVGENGPELAYLPNGTRIQTHGASIGALRRNRGGGTVVNNYYALRSDEYARLIADAQAGGDMARQYSNPTRTGGYLRGRA